MIAIISWKNDSVNNTRPKELPSEVSLPIGIAATYDTHYNIGPVKRFLERRYGWGVEDFSIIKN